MENFYTQWVICLSYINPLQGLDVLTTPVCSVTWFSKLIIFNSIATFFYLQILVFDKIFRVVNVRGDTHMTPTLREERGKSILSGWDIIGRMGWGVASVLHAQHLFFYSRKFDLNYYQTSCWFKHYILSTRNLPIDSGARQWSHPLMIPLHCLWAKLNNRGGGQFEYNMAWFCFCFDFVYSQAQCGCYSIVC